jgi:hypothetical protein
MDKNRFARGEFMEFMDRFLKTHPEVVKDQNRGWNIYWNPEIVSKDELGENVEDVLADEMQP